jgi:hypothetical protein
MIDLNKPFGWDDTASTQGGSNTVGPLGGGNAEGTAPVLQLPETEQEKVLKEAKGKAGKMAADETIKGLKAFNAPDVGAGMASAAEEAAINTALADAGGAGMASVAEQAAIDAATGTATTSAASSVAGPIAGGVLSAAQGNYGQAAGQTVGGIVGSYFGPLGTMAGSALGGYLGGLTGYSKGTAEVMGYAEGTTDVQGKSTGAAQPMAAQVQTPMQPAATSGGGAGKATGAAQPMGALAQMQPAQPELQAAGAPRNNYYGELKQAPLSQQGGASGAGKGTGHGAQVPTQPTRASAQAMPIPFTTVKQTQEAQVLAAQQAGYVSPEAQAQAAKAQQEYDDWWAYEQQRQGMSTGGD